MNHAEFEHIFNQQVKLCEEVLVKKAAEYATEDRLHNFKVAAALQGTTVRQALAGMLAKHVVSVFDMCASEDSNTIAVWDEKLGDALNYLFLLKAVVVEELEGDHPKLPPAFLFIPNNT